MKCILICLKGLCFEVANVDTFVNLLRGHEMWNIGGKTRWDLGENGQWEK